jgi:hypothetical protein
MKIEFRRMPWFLTIGLLAVGAAGCKGGAGKAATGPAKIGDTVSFSDSDWVVMEALDLGTTMEPTGILGTTAKTTGKFVEVHFKVTNKSKQAISALGGPHLADGKARDIGPYTEQAEFLPSDAKTLILETIQPSITTEYYSIYEVPGDATDLKFQATSFGLLNDTKSVSLDSMKKAPPVVPGKIGEAVTLTKSEWTVLDAKNLGQKMKSRAAYIEKDAKTDGKYIQVHTKLTNKASNEQLGMTPKLMDSKGREFGAFDKETWFVPKDAKTLPESLQPAASHDYYTIYEVPADASGLLLKVSDLEGGGSKKIDLGM